MCRAIIIDGVSTHFTEPSPRVAMLREALEALEERGYLEVIKPPRDGLGQPPSLMVRVRPEIMSAWR